MDTRRMPAGRCRRGTTIAIDAPFPAADVASLPPDLLRGSARRLTGHGPTARCRNHSAATVPA